MIPDHQTLMLPVLRRLVEREWRTAELVESLAQEFNLSSAEAAELLPAGKQTKLANRVHWALAYLNRAGLIVRIEPGLYAASDTGRKLMAAPPEQITVAFLLQHYAPKAHGADDAAMLGVAGPDPLAAAASGATPDDAIDAAVAAIEAQAKEELLDRLLKASPARFERVVVDLLLAMGYGTTAEDAGQTIGGTGDGGVDGVIREDRLGLDLIYVQAKRYKDTAVTADQLRSFAGALEGKGARKGVLITTSWFTASAKSFAASLQTKRIALVDRDHLTSLMLRHDVGVRAARTIVLKKPDVGYFDPNDLA